MGGCFKELRPKSRSMVVAEYYMDDLLAATRLKKEQIMAGLDQIGAPCSEGNGEKGKLIVELTPNRLDFLSFSGIVRALLSYFGKRKPGTYEAKPSRYEVIVDESVSKIRPYTVCAVAKGLDFSGHQLEYLIQFQEKLHATIGRKVKKLGMGFYPLENLKFPIYYTTMKPEEIRYQPLGYPGEASAREILTRHPKGKENGWIIQDAARYPVFLDADRNILCLIPICNAEKYGKVTPETRDVFIEVTGMDLTTNLAVMDLVACSFADAGAAMHKVRMVYPHRSFTAPALEARTTKLDLGFTNRVLGSNITAAGAGKLLARMDLALEKWSVISPPYRIDIVHPVDIVEDIAIAHGYNRFGPTLPDFFSAGKSERLTPPWHAALQGMGFLETQTFVLSSTQRMREYGHTPPLEVLNPVTAEYSTFRASLVPGLLDTFAINRVSGLPQKIYEIGQAFDPGQVWRVGFGVMDKEVGFSQMRGYLQTLLAEQGVKFELQPLQSSAYLDIRHSGEIWTGGTRRGVVGRVLPEFLGRRQLQFEVYIGELDL